MGDGMESQLLEALHLDAVVHDVAKRVHLAMLAKSTLGLANSPNNTEAEARIIVYAYLHTNG